jgi:plasmid maintenance system antidote protein VapI
MKTIQQELDYFFGQTGCSQRKLALIAGVPAPTVNMLLRGKRRSVNYKTADKLRYAMQFLMFNYQQNKTA